MHRALKTEIQEPAGFAINEVGNPVAFRETPELAQCRTALIEVHEVCKNASFCKKSESLSRVRVLFRAENLNLPCLGCRAWHFRLSTIVGFRSAATSVGE
jgi:hypothetical protein